MDKGDAARVGPRGARTHPVEMPAGVRPAKVAAGWEHWAVVDSRGRVWAWGSDEFGQLCDYVVTDRRRPVLVRGPPGWLEVAQVAAGEHHSLALATDGSVCSWGGNMCGELGLGPDVEWRHRPARVRLPA